MAELRTIRTGWRALEVSRKPCWFLDYCGRDWRSGERRALQRVVPQQGGHGSTEISWFVPRSIHQISNSQLQRQAAALQVAGGTTLRLLQSNNVSVSSVEIHIGNDVQFKALWWH